MSKKHLQKLRYHRNEQLLGSEPSDNDIDLCMLKNQCDQAVAELRTGAVVQEPPLALSEASVGDPVEYANRVPEEGALSNDPPGANAGANGAEDKDTSEVSSKIIKPPSDDVSDITDGSIERKWEGTEGWRPNKKKLMKKSKDSNQGAGSSSSSRKRAKLLVPFAAAVAAGMVSVADGARYPMVQVGERVIALPINTNIMHLNLEILKIVAVALSVYTVDILILVLFCWRQGKSAKTNFAVPRGKDPEAGAETPSTANLEKHNKSGQTQCTYKWKLTQPRFVALPKDEAGCSP